MTSGKQKYELPSNIQSITTSNCNTVPKFDAERTIIDTESPFIGRVFAYRWCYLDRLSFIEKIKINKKKQVNLSSLCPQRTEIVRKLILGEFTNPNQLALRHVSQVFDWIDLLNRGEELHAIDSTKRLYQAFTKHLRHRIQLSNVGEKKAGAIGYGHACRSQSGMALICSMATGLSISVIRSWAYQIPLRNKSPARSLPTPGTTEKEHIQTHALHTRFFTAFCDAVLNNRPPPVVIELSDLGYDDLIFYKPGLNSAQRWNLGTTKSLTEETASHFYSREGVFQGSFKCFQELLAKNNIEPLQMTRQVFVTRQRHAQNFSDSDLRYMANVATRHFGYLLLAETGSNASTLATIDCSRVRLDKTLGASRLLAVKGRAGYKQEDQFVDLRFANTVWKRYLELRDWMVQCLRRERLEAPQHGLFLLKGKMGKKPYYPLNSASIRILNLWPKNGPPLNTRNARKHKIVIGLEHTDGNLALISGMQMVSTQTVERHYAFKNITDAAIQMSDYFNAQAKSATLRREGLPVRIISGGDKTSTGHCEALEKDGPQLIKGFESTGILPRCEAPLTCLFCVHFGIHATAEDLLQLLTIKHWVEIQSRLYASSIDESFSKYVPYINRIDQIFEELPQSDKALSKIFLSAKTLFDQGIRNSYWEAKINALLDSEED